MDILEDNGMCYDCEDLTVVCYSNIMRELGYCENDACDKTVEELCNEYPDDILLVRLEGHLTCCVNGCCYDIWDCTGEKADIFWIVE